MEVICPVSLGELVDKISILQIKKKFVIDRDKRQHILKEELVLLQVLEALNLNGIEKYLDELLEINTALWKIEDDIRDLERKKNFGKEFIHLARMVYFTNDQRFQIKNEINQTYGSPICEVKSYKDVHR